MSGGELGIPVSIGPAGGAVSREGCDWMYRCQGFFEPSGVSREFRWFGEGWGGQAAAAACAWVSSRVRVAVFACQEPGLPDAPATPSPSLDLDFGRDEDLGFT